MAKKVASLELIVTHAPAFFHKSSLFITDLPSRIISNINIYIDFYNQGSARSSVGPLYRNE